MKDWLIDGVVLGVLAGILSAAFLDWWAEREERARLPVGLSSIELWNGSGWIASWPRMRRGRRVIGRVSDEA